MVILTFKRIFEMSYHWSDGILCCLLEDDFKNLKLKEEINEEQHSELVKESESPNEKSESKNRY